MEKSGKDKEACTCPICMYIMIEPVTMPCQHSLCMPCYKQTVEKANLTCPLCRTRISVWARKAAKAKSLVNNSMWEAIKNAFPDKVQSRLEGREVSDDEGSDGEDYETRLRKMKEVSKPGEIRQEYETALKKLQHQKEEEAKKEEEASASLIRAIQQQEEEEMEELYRRREEIDRLGRQVAEQLQQESDLESRGLTDQSPQLTSSRSNSSQAWGPKKGSKTGNNRQPNRPTSVNMTLNTFFSPVPRSTKSVRPDDDSASENFESAASPTKLKDERSKTSPYPYACISPQDKIFYGLSALTAPSRQRHNSSSSDEAPCLLEHSYTTASARRIDLTSAESDQLALPRRDVRDLDLSRVKSEPEDIFGPGPSGTSRWDTIAQDALCSYGAKSTDANLVMEETVDSLEPCSSYSSQNQFQPITVCQRTPPKRLANGAVCEPPLIRALPRNLTFVRVPAAPGSVVNSAESTLTSSTHLGKGKVTCVRNTSAALDGEASHQNGKGKGKSSKSSRAFAKTSSISDAGTSCGSIDKSSDSNTKSEYLHKLYETLHMSALSTSHSERSDSTNPSENCNSPASSRAETDICTEVLSRHNTNMIDMVANLESKSAMEVDESSSNLDAGKIHLKDESLKPLACNDENLDVPDNSVNATSHSVDSSKQSDVSLLAVKMEQPLQASKKQNLKCNGGKAVSTSTLGVKDVTVSIQRWCVPQAALDDSFKQNLPKDRSSIGVKKLNQKPKVKNTLDSFVQRHEKKVVNQSKTETKSEPEEHILNMGIDSYATDSESSNCSERNVSKRKCSDLEDEVVCVDNEVLCATNDVDSSKMTQEEADHRLALQLQDLYTKLDRSKINVDRFKGAKDQYLLRKKRRFR